MSASLLATASLIAPLSVALSVVVPVRWPSPLEIAIVSLRTEPAVVTSLAAKRVWASCASPTLTSHSSALEKESTRSTSSLACSRVQLMVMRSSRR